MHQRIYLSIHLAATSDIAPVLLLTPHIPQGSPVSWNVSSIAAILSTSGSCARFALNCPSRGGCESQPSGNPKTSRTRACTPGHTHSHRHTRTNARTHTRTCSTHAKMRSRNAHHCRCSRRKPFGINFHELLLVVKLCPDLRHMSCECPPATERSALCVAKRGMVQVHSGCEGLGTDRGRGQERTPKHEISVLHARPASPAMQEDSPVATAVVCHAGTWGCGC